MMFEALTGYPVEDVQDCMAFFGLSEIEVRQRMGETWHRVARLWREANPQTEAERQAWYATTDAHIFEGLAWHAQLEQRRFREAIAARCTGTVLDWGAGVGTEGLLALRCGCSVVFVEWGLIRDFLVTRVERVLTELCNTVITGEYHANGATVRSYTVGPIHSWIAPPDEAMIFLNAWTSGELSFPGDPPFDTIICLDVLEHLDDPEAVLADFRRWLKPDGLFIGSAPFDDLQYDGHLPQHQGKRLTQLCEQAGLMNYWIDPIRPGEVSC